MKSSPNINELAAALAKAQSEITPAHKSSTNPYFKSAYADLETVWETCRPHLAKHGLAVTQILYMHESGGVRLETVVLHASGQWISGELPVEPVKKDPQGLGSAITYMRRYGLQSTLCLVTRGDDDDGNSASDDRQVHKRPGAMPPELPTKPQSDDPGEWVVNSGTRYLNKKLKTIPVSELVECVQAIKDNAFRNKQPTTGAALQFVEKAEAYITSKTPKDPWDDQSNPN